MAKVRDEDLDTHTWRWTGGERLSDPRQHFEAPEVRIPAFRDDHFVIGRGMGLPLLREMVTRPCSYRSRKTTGSSRPRRSSNA